MPLMRKEQIMQRPAFYGVMVASVLCLGAGVAFAQGTQRRLAPEEQIRVRRFIGTGPRARATTPIYQTNLGAGTKRAQDWHVVSVIYDSAPEWMDDLLVQFHVMTVMKDRQSGRNVYSLFKKTVRYVDIERGRDHRAMAFLRPAATKRYGDVVASAAVLTVEGKVVDEQSETADDLPEFWWRNSLVLDSEALTVRDGYLLNRMESPWALINPDDYEVIK
jgi:hypothetical protein